MLELAVCGLCGAGCTVSELRTYDGNELCPRCYRGAMSAGQELERVRELVKICHGFIDVSDDNTPNELLFVLGVVEELADKLGVTL
jgi:hypothetical protein